MRSLTLEFKAAIVLFLISGLTISAIYWWSAYDFYLATGRWSRSKSSASSRNVIAVSGWGPSGLTLEDGRTVPLPALRSLPDESVAMTEVLKRGVIIYPMGHVTALVKIDHTSKNDPKREHVVEVDLNEMARFLGMKYLLASDDKKLPRTSVRGAATPFTAKGWDVAEFEEFQSWTD